MLFTYARYFTFTFGCLLVVQVHSFRLIHHYKPDLIYLDAPLQRPPVAATAVSIFAAGHGGERAKVSDAVTTDLPAGRGLGRGTDARRTVACGRATEALAGPVMVSPTWKLLRSSRASAADPAKKPNTNAQRNMPRSRCAAAFPIAARVCRNGT